MNSADLPLRPQRLAIVGFSYRFPTYQSRDAGGEDFWSSLMAGRNLVSTVHASRWSRERFVHPRKSEPGTSYTMAAGSLGDVSGFDAAFFGISPREAAQLDPQQRLLLELSWEAFESAGIPPSSVRGTRGSVYVGFSGSDYAQRSMDDFAAASSFSMTGIAGSIAANRLSYCYDLRGPSLSVDTACSSSLVALHEACKGLLAGETDAALVGAVNLHLHPFPYIAFSKAAMLSRRGICSPFDAEGDGYVRSEGGAILMLKRLEDALDAGERIFGVVAASCVNSDGRTNGITVPSCEAQTALLNEVYARAGIDPAQIDYLEAHGTGTPVGDPIEARALGEALGKRRAQPLPIGSVKSNLGHLETAAGMAGVVKALYSLRERRVPPTINFRRPNPHIPFRDLNLEVVTQARALDPQKRLVIGVNSFGFGGTNAHVVLESAPQPGPSRAGKAPRAAPFIVSARSEAALKAAARRSADWLTERGDADYYDLAYSAAFHRDWLEHRAVVFAHDREAAARALADFAKGAAASGVATSRQLQSMPGLAFVYSGNGSQWAGMGKRLFKESPVFAQAVEEVDALWGRRSELRLAESLARDDVAQLLASTEHAQPLLFALQVGLTRLLASWGVVPAAVTGHSVGEIAAAWASGALTLEQAVEVVYWRSTLQAPTRGAGAMSAVALGEEDLRALVAEAGVQRYAVAALNSPKGVTLAAPVAELERIESALAARGVAYRRLALDYAFHSSAMDSLEAPLKRALEDLRPDATRIAFYSTVTGGLLEGEELGAEYWWKNIRQPVQFGRAIGALATSGFGVFVEVGPQPALRNYILEGARPVTGEVRASATMSRAGDGVDAVREKALQLVAAGSPADVACLFPEKGEFAELPTYPWQRERHWYVPTSEAPDRLTRERVHPLLGYRLAGTGHAWENHVDPLAIPELADHRVGGQIVFAAAAFAEMALAAARDALGAAEIYEVLDLEIRAPLALDEQHSRSLRFALDGDGRFTVRSRDRMSADPWRAHVVGKLAAGSQAELCVSPALARCCEPNQPESAAVHYQIAAALGLEYGPAFRLVERLWRDGNAVCARLRGTEGGALAHTRSLDACFQLLIHALRDETSSVDIAYVPVKVERLVLASDAEACTARLELVRRGPRSALARCSLRDAEGNVVMDLDGVRFRAVQLRKKETQLRMVECRSYRKGLAPAPLERVAEACRARLHERARIQAREQYFQDVEPLLEALLAAFAKEALEHAVPPLDTATNPLVACLREVAGTEAYPPAREIWAQVLGDHPDHAYEAIWLGRLGLHLPALLRGAAWTGGTPETGAHFATAIADATRELLRAVGPTRRPRLALLDAGRSASLPLILDRLDTARCDCVILCADAAAFEDRRALAARHRGVVVRMLDLASEAAELPVEAKEPFDLVIAEDAVLAGLQPKTLLATLRRLCAEGAAVLLADQRHSRAVTLAERILVTARGAGITPWIAPARDASQWRAQLAEHGFVGVVAIPESPELESESQLFLARLPRGAQAARTVEPGAFALLARERGPSAEIAERLEALLREHGHAARITAATLEGLDAVRAVVDITGLGGTEDEQAARCADAGKLLERLAAAPRPPAVWFVTGAAHRFPDEAAFAGFLRTAINEYRNLSVRHADLDEPTLPDAMVQALMDVLLDPQAESEVVLGADGCQVPRVQLVAGAPAEAEAAAGANVRLEVPPTGQLRSLAWKAHPARAPGDGEIEIDVRAAGLNFRDVMYAMGHLPDEALEDGFAGPSLGMEVAGVVRAAGANVRGLRAGDEVIAFAPAGFSTRVVTTAGAAVKKPIGWSFEAAATIPATFLTAYYALHDLARLEEGQRVLIHGAAGGVGLAAVQLAQMVGAEIFATAGSEAKRDVLRLYGVEHVLDSRTLAFADEVRHRTNGEGVDVVLNSLAGEAMMRSLQVLKPFGRFLELGKRDFYENTRIGLRPLRQNIAYFAIDADQLMRERPGLSRRLMQELMLTFKSGRLKPLPFRAFPAAEAVEAFRYMQQSRQVGKIVLSFDPPPTAVAAPKPRAERLSLSPNATYLVTGGLRGFGLKTAQWLAAKGARTLVLASRSGATDAEAEAAIEALELAGVRVELATCDVADRGALERLLESVRASLPPLRGVVHAAATIQDGLIRNLTREAIEAVFAPKVAGARNLDRLTRTDPLDFFVLYSSATTLFGNPGQAAYVAANRYLEVLAAARRSEGLPALCVSWGPIGDAGYLARHPQFREALEGRMGGSALGAEEALDVLEELLVSGQAGPAVLKFDRGGPARMLSGAASPKFQPLLAHCEQGEQAMADGETLARLLEELSDEELAVAFSDIVKKEIGEILRMPPDKLELDKPLADLGLDSLMGVELMTAVEARFGISIPVMAMTEIGSIERLVQRIILELRRGQGGAAPAADGGVDAQVRRIAEQHAAGEIDEAQLEALTRDFRASEK